MLKKAAFVLLFAILLVLPVGALSAQGPSPTPGGFGSFFDALGTATPTTSTQQFRYSSRATNTQSGHADAGEK
jgi:hypothetical protein